MVPYRTTVIVGSSSRVSKNRVFIPFAFKYILSSVRRGFSPCRSRPIIVHVVNTGSLCYVGRKAVNYGLFFHEKNVWMHWNVCSMVEQKFSRTSIKLPIRNARSMLSVAMRIFRVSVIQRACGDSIKIVIMLYSLWLIRFITVSAYTYCKRNKKRIFYRFFFVIWKKIKIQW